MCKRTVMSVTYLVNLFFMAILTCHQHVNSYNNEDHPRPTYLEAKVGSFVVFNCPLEFPMDTPIPYVLHWNKEGKTVFSWYDGVLSASNIYVGRINLLENNEEYGKGSVNLTAIRESDGGWYECRVIFPNRTPSSRLNGTWFHLTVDGGALMKIPPVNITVMEGEMATFLCVIKHPSTSFVTWYKDNTLLTDMVDLAHRSILGPDGSLTINPTIMSDLGEYECVIQDYSGEKQAAKAFLNVQYKAKVIYAPPEVYLPFGQPAVLDCHFRSNPPLTNLRWEKDNFLFDPYNVQGVFYKRNGSLFFNKVDDSHAGSYSCTPYNELGTAGPSAAINVIVQKPPILTIKPKQVYIYKLGDKVEMACDARDREGQHRPTIVWTRKDGVPLPLDRFSMEGGNLTIDNIEENDRGIYQCSAMNEAATVSADTELLIEKFPPRAPYNLTASSTATEITLRWQPGIIRSSLRYIIWYRLTETAEWRTFQQLSRSIMETKISNLEPGREYEFMVLGQDEYGDGIFSKAFRYYTKPREFQDPEQYHDPIETFSQIGPPRNLTVDQSGNDYIVTWEPPEYGLDTLRLYIVKWWHEPKHILQGTAETIETYYIVKNLEEDGIYKFQVSSISTTNYEASSNEFEITIPAFRRMRAIAIGLATGLIFLLIAVLAFVYLKRKWLKQARGKGNPEKMIN